MQRCSIDSPGLRARTTPSFGVTLACLAWLLAAAACGEPAGESGNPPPRELRSIAITPGAPAVAAGASLQLAALGTYSDATTGDLTALVTWQSAAAATASVSAAGVLTGQRPGTVEVTAALDGITARATAAIGAPALTAIEVTPGNLRLATGIAQQLTATGVFGNATTLDLTQQVVWSSDAPGRAAVSPTGRVFASAEGTATITATLGSIRGTTTLTATGAALVELQLTPPAPAVARGRTLQLTATGVFGDATTTDLTDQVTWRSEAPGVATVDERGRIQPVAPGVVRIVATIGAARATTELTVTDAVLEVIEVAPLVRRVARGLTLQLTATGRFSDARVQDLTAQVAWSTSNAAIATVVPTGPAAGRVTGVATGAVTITASLDGVVATVPVTVTDAVLLSIAVTPPAPRVAGNLAVQLTATGMFSDARSQDLTTQVTWSTSDPLVATVSNAAGSQGVAIARAAGTATIQATLPGVTDVTGSTALTVLAVQLTRIEITPAGAQIPLGLTVPFAATGVFSDDHREDLTAQVTWTSTIDAVAQVSNAAGSRGRVTARARGTTGIRARLGLIDSQVDVEVTSAALTSLAIAPRDASFEIDTAQRYTATGAFSDGTSRDVSTQVTWSSSDATIVEMFNAEGLEGLAAMRRPGTVTIRATSGAIQASTQATVIDVVLQAIVVDPATAGIPLGRGRQLTATGMFSNGTTRDLTRLADWLSSEPGAATVDNAPGVAGLVLSRQRGTATITASVGDVVGSAVVTVIDPVLEAVAVERRFPESGPIRIGRPARFEAEARFSNGFTRDVTAEAAWTSSDAGIAEVSNAAGSQGRATGIAPGTVAIRATFEGMTASAPLTVLDVRLRALTLSPRDAELPLGRPLAFSATGTFTDDETEDLTPDVTWTSSNPAVVEIVATGATGGRITTRALGTTTIRATLGAITASTELTVVAPVLDVIVIDPVVARIPAGLTQQFTATARFTDGSTEDRTAAVTWTSSRPEIGAIVNAPPGLFTARAAGTTAISAFVAGVQVASVGVTVLAPIPTGVRVTEFGQIVAGRVVQFVARLELSDDTLSAPVTETATWASSDPAVATVSSTAGSRGRATTRAEGVTTITATIDGLVGSSELQVRPPEPMSIVVLPANPPVAVGRTLQLRAVVTFTDGHTEELTDQVAWLSRSPHLVTVSNEDGSRGVVTGINPGEGVIQVGLRDAVGMVFVRVVP